jgi:hypothetical protein
MTAALRASVTGIMKSVMDTVLALIESAAVEILAKSTEIDNVILYHKAIDLIVTTTAIVAYLHRKGHRN